MNDIDSGLATLSCCADRCVCVHTRCTPGSVDKPELACRLSRTAHAWFHMRDLLDHHAFTCTHSTRAFRWRNAGHAVLCGPLQTRRLHETVADLTNAVHS
jgi:hypothetical protein